MRKLVYVLLVVAMLGSVVAGIYFYASPSNKAAASDPFADVPSPSIKSLKWADASAQDVSAVDFSKESNMETLTFDSGTKWPAADKLPSGFSPDVLMDQARYLGLGLTGIHKSGITGKGVPVAVIDKPLNKDHEQFKDNIDYIEMVPGDASMQTLNYHGAAVSSILAGKDGVAPGAQLYYFAIPDDDQPYVRYAEAMTKLLSVNNSLPDAQKVRLVVVAMGVDPSAVSADTAGAADWATAIKNAQDSGIIVVYPGMPDIDMTGAGCVPSKDRDDPANYAPWSWTIAKGEIVQKLNDAKVTTWDAARAELIRLLTETPDLDPLQAEAINTFIYTLESYKTGMNYDTWLGMMNADLSGSIAFPADYLTVAGTESAGAYAYYGSGALSWSTPYVAGLLALGLQVKPTATAAEMYQAMMDTATPFSNGGKLVNPAAYLEALK